MVAQYNSRMCTNDRSCDSARIRVAIRIASDSLRRGMRIFEINSEVTGHDGHHTAHAAIRSLREERLVRPEAPLCTAYAHHTRGTCAVRAQCIDSVHRRV